MKQTNKYRQSHIHWLMWEKPHNEWYVWMETALNTETGHGAVKKTVWNIYMFPLIESLQVYVQNNLNYV